MIELNYEIISTIGKVLIYVALPIVAIMALSGFLAGIFQSFLSMKEESISYCIKIVALGGYLYYAYPMIFELFKSLFKEAFA